MQLIFDHSVGSGLFRTGVITDSVIPSLLHRLQRHAIKQYHREGQALDTETTLSNTRDFYLGMNLHNLRVLCKVRFQANRRVVKVPTFIDDSVLAEKTLQQLHRLRMVGVSALRFADPTVQALWNAMPRFDLLPDGLS